MIYFYDGLLLVNGYSIIKYYYIILARFLRYWYYYIRIFAYLLTKHVHVHTWYIFQVNLH